MLRPTYHSVLVFSFALLLTVPVAIAQNWSGHTFTHSDLWGNSMRLWYGANENGVGGSLPTSGALDKPFILVEGFDPDFNMLASDYYDLGSSFFDEARKAGADILILNFANGADDMLENAVVVKHAVRYISRIKTGSTQIRLAGVSMGGVIARYALAEAGDLDVSHYVSLDAPHRGAAIDRDVLAWVKDPPVDVPGLNSFVSSRVLDMRNMLRTQAAKQMLVYNPYSNGEHDALMDSLNSAGYPGTTNIGVAFSSGRDKVIVGDGEWLAIEVPIAVATPEFFHFYISPGDAISRGGSFLPYSFTDDAFMERKAHPTYIPHTSALDGGTSSFNVQLSADYDRYHNEFPDELGEPLLHWLDLKTVPLRASIGGHGSLSEHTAGKWNATDVGGGSGFYEYRWEHWYTCPPGGTRDVRCNAWHSVGRGND